MISFGVSGWIGAAYGWPSIFYFSGCAAAAWAVLWAIIGADNPSSSWLVSDNEKIFIEKKLLLTSEISVGTTLTHSHYYFICLFIYFEIYDFLYAEGHKNTLEKFVH